MPQLIPTKSSWKINMTHPCNSSKETRQTLTNSIVSEISKVTGRRNIEKLAIHCKRKRDPDVSFGEAIVQDKVLGVIPLQRSLQNLFEPKFFAGFSTNVGESSSSLLDFPSEAALTSRITSLWQSANQFTSTENKDEVKHSLIQKR